MTLNLLSSYKLHRGKVFMTCLMVNFSSFHLGVCVQMCMCWNLHTFVEQTSLLLLTPHASLCWSAAYRMKCYQVTVTAFGPSLHTQTLRDIALFLKGSYFIAQDICSKLAALGTVPFWRSKTNHSLIITVNLCGRASTQNISFLSDRG